MKEEDEAAAQEQSQPEPVKTVPDALEQVPVSQPNPADLSPFPPDEKAGSENKEIPDSVKDHEESGYKVTADVTMQSENAGETGQTDKKAGSEQEAAGVLPSQEAETKPSATITPEVAVPAKSESTPSLQEAWEGQENAAKNVACEKKQKLE